MNGECSTLERRKGVDGMAMAQGAIGRRFKQDNDENVIWRKVRVLAI